MNKAIVVLVALSLLVFASCRRNSSEHVTIALPEPFSTFDTLTSVTSDAAAERVRNLMFNSLVKKNDNFEYVGEMAEQITTSEDGKTITFTLRDNIKFHNGKVLASSDVKYTFDTLFASKGYKAAAFYDSVPVSPVRSNVPTPASTDANTKSPGTPQEEPKSKLEPHITAIETPDTKTVVFTVARPALKNQLLSNLVAIPIIAEGTAETQKDSPIGSGPFKFIRFDASQNTVEMEAFADYFEGSPKVPKILVKTVTDASSLQAELQTGGVDIAPMPTNLPPDTLNILGQDANLKIEQFDGSNIQYIGLNTRSAPLDKVKVRQAIGYAVDRDKLIRELLSGQAKKANSILPESSWAYTPGVEYNYDPAKARQLLAEAGYKNEPIKFKFSSGNAAFNSYVQAIQNNLKEVGLNVEIEPLDPGTLRDQLRNGQFQLNTGVWIGGNQDPIFLKDLFTTGRIPGPGVACCNRSRYSNPEVDTLIQEAIDAIDREVAKAKYQAAWAKISEELPLMPLWYPANMVVSNKRIIGIRVSPSGDWGFIRNIEISK